MFEKVNTEYFYKSFIGLRLKDGVGYSDDDFMEEDEMEDMDE
jgi:hypothetical protein